MWLQEQLESCHYWFFVTTGKASYQLATTTAQCQLPPSHCPTIQTVSVCLSLSLFRSQLVRVTIKGNMNVLECARVWYALKVLQFACCQFQFPLISLSPLSLSPSLLSVLFLEIWLIFERSQAKATFIKMEFCAYNLNLHLIFEINWDFSLRFEWIVNENQYVHSVHGMHK